jgi:hypothetical protein
VGFPAPARWADFLFPFQKDSDMTDETNAAEAAPKQQRRSVDADHEALLARYGLGELPVVFAIRNGDGSIIQEKAACYQCSTEGFYGRGMTGTFYQEGDIIVAEFTPNEYMVPLNRAAALKYAMWRESLPQNRAPIDIGDLSEAAQMLAKDPRVTDLPPDDYQKAVTELATRLKIKRAGKDAMELIPIAHNFNPQSGGKAPPILGAKLSDMGARGPGFTNTPPAGATTVRFLPLPVRRFSGIVTFIRRER